MGTKVDALRGVPGTPVAGGWRLGSTTKHDARGGGGPVVVGCGCWDCLDSDERQREHRVPAAWRLALDRLAPELKFAMRGP